MRSRATNILQGIVLLTGLIYILLGLFLYISPVSLLKIFAENVSENWLDLVRDNELVAPLYYLTRGFSALVFTSGLAMIMPLFEPLRYRGLIYYNGLIFPFLAGALFMYNGFIRMLTAGEIVTVDGKLISAGNTIHLPVVILGIVFSLICLLTAVGLAITKKQAGSGLE